MELQDQLIDNLLQAKALSARNDVITAQLVRAQQALQDTSAELTTCLQDGAPPSRWRFLEKRVSECLVRANGLKTEAQTVHAEFKACRAARDQLQVEWRREGKTLTDLMAFMRTDPRCQALL